MQIFNRVAFKRLRQKLRGNMPDPERILWCEIRAGQLADCKFRRQHGIGEYIVDFYCRKAQLVIEVDGDSHFEPEQQIQDRKRAQFLESLGLKVLRFTNHEIRTNLSGVLETIHAQIKL